MTGGWSWRVVLALAAAGCGAPGPRVVAMGVDECSHCHMLTADPRFPAQLVTRTGKILVFDDPGCLARYLDGTSLDRVHSLWVTDFLEPDSLLRAEEALYLKSPSIASPMGFGVAAVRPGRPADSLAAALGAERLAWQNVLDRGGHAYPAASRP